MYDEYAKHLIEILPDLPGLNKEKCRRALSLIYFHTIQQKLEIDSSDRTEDIDEAFQLLRRLADALESLVVFDSNGVSDETRRAAAFVAAEALALLATLIDHRRTDVLVEDPILDGANYAAIEACFMYLIGDYTINAVSIAKRVRMAALPSDLNNLNSHRLNNANYVLSRISSLCNGKVYKPRDAEGLIVLEDQGNCPADYDLIIHDIRIRVYAQIGNVLDDYLDWLGGYSNIEIEDIVARINSIQTAASSSNYVGYAAFSDIYHLASLLSVVVKETSKRSLLHTVPSPDPSEITRNINFHGYLESRARGNEDSNGRPFLWPSALEYVQMCLPGPQKDAVVSMPTGSGKSFVAELAVLNALHHGWVLYLAPTNALVHQVRRDLKDTLRDSGSRVSVRAFVGDQEYTTLTEEQINFPDALFVAVMTPEKCALAIRLYPEKFAECALCVFDECHLLNDDRGITADILLAQLSIRAPNVRYLLMSAMVGNPEDLAGWLTSMQRDAVAIKIKWRPTRTMRGLLLLNKMECDSSFRQAKDELRNLPTGRVNQKFEAPLALISGLSGPWSVSGPEDYKIVKLPLSFPAQAKRNEDRPDYKGWKNLASRIIAEKLASLGLPTLCFVLSSRHHAFSLAESTSLSMPGAIGNGQFDDLVESWLKIAETELGVETLLRSLLRRGIAVHTSALLQVEHAASERMFLKQKANLMFATGTLAQGLNLPALAVVIAGTSMGDPRNQSPNQSTRVDALILNAFGRAGRPSFANQSLAVLVSDHPYSADISSELDPSNALEQYGVLGKNDASIEVHSPIEGFIDNVMAGEIDTAFSTKEELALTSLLAEYDHDLNHSGLILSRTLAAYHKRERFTDEMIRVARERISTVKRNFLDKPETPAWLNTAAMKSGVDFFRAEKIWLAYKRRGVIEASDGAELDIEGWRQVFFEVMSLLPPFQIRHYLPHTATRDASVLNQMKRSLGDNNSIDENSWDIPQNWQELWRELEMIVGLYMNGASYADIASSYLKLQRSSISNGRSGTDPIPKVFKLLSEVVFNLAIDAGCFLAIHQAASELNVPEIPESLQALPLCIKHGCHNLSVLSWYRFGYQERVCAHALQNSFPVDVTLGTDSERANWVRQTRDQWLSGDIEASDDVLRYAAIVMTHNE